MPSYLAAQSAMGTRFEFVLVGPDSEQLRAVTEEAGQEIQRLETRWSAFRADSELSEVNRCAADRPVRVEAQTMQILVRARELWHETNHAVDPALGALIEAWGFRHPASISLAVAEVAQALASSGLDHVELDPVRRTVRFRRPGLRLDLGAFGKGYAVDIAVEVCRSAGIESGLIHAGTSTVYAFGERSPGTPWRVGIPTPETARAGLRAADLTCEQVQSGMLTTVILRNQALSVSAIWGREVLHDGRAYGHVLDPGTGQPVQGIQMAAVLAESAFEADALSTALLVGGEPLQDQLARNRSGWRSLLVAVAGGDAGARLIDHGLAERDRQV